MAEHSFIGRPEGDHLPSPTTNIVDPHHLYHSTFGAPPRDLDHRSSKPPVEPAPSHTINSPSETAPSKPPVEPPPIKPTKPPVEPPPTKPTKPPVEPPPTKPTKPPVEPPPTNPTKPPVEPPPHHPVVHNFAPYSPPAEPFSPHIPIRHKSETTTAKPGNPGTNSEVHTTTPEHVTPGPTQHHKPVPVIDHTPEHHQPPVHTPEHHHPTHHTPEHHHPTHHTPEHHHPTHHTPEHSTHHVPGHHHHLPAHHHHHHHSEHHHASSPQEHRAPTPAHKPEEHKPPVHTPPQEVHKPAVPPADVRIPVKPVVPPVDVHTPEKPIVPVPEHNPPPPEVPPPQVVPDKVVPPTIEPPKTVVDKTSTPAQPPQAEQKTSSMRPPNYGEVSTSFSSQQVLSTVTVGGNFNARDYWRGSLDASLAGKRTGLGDVTVTLGHSLYDTYTKDGNSRNGNLNFEVGAVLPTGKTFQFGKLPQVGDAGPVFGINGYYGLDRKTTAYGALTYALHPGSQSTYEYDAQTGLLRREGRFTFGLGAEMSKVDGDRTSHFFTPSIEYGINKNTSVYASGALNLDGQKQENALWTGVRFKF